MLLHFPMGSKFRVICSIATMQLRQLLRAPSARRRSAMALPEFGAGLGVIRVKSLGPLLEMLEQALKEE